MPLVYFDVFKGRSAADLKKMLDVSHEVFVETLNLPQNDRFQILRQHEPFEMNIEDTGLGFKRSDHLLVLTIVSRQRETEQKTRLYQRLSEDLERHCQLSPKDLMISFIVNQDTDWSFGFGRAQFLTGEL